MGSGLMDCELLYPHAEYQEQAPGSPFLACQLHFLKQWPPPHLQWKLNFLTGDNSGKKKDVLRQIIKKEHSSLQCLP